MKTLKQEYNYLIKYSKETNILRSLFPSGYKGYVRSRTVGCYSFDAIKQSVDIVNR